MSVSHRKFRAQLFDFVDAGDEGETDSAYALNESTASDGMWWCSKTQPTGREVTTGMKAEHRVDAVFGFAAEAPVTLNGAIHCEGESFAVRAILPRDYGTNEVQVLAAREAGLTLTAS